MPGAIYCQWLSWKRSRSSSYWGKCGCHGNNEIRMRTKFHIHVHHSWQVKKEIILCAYVFHCFHDNRQQKWPQALFPITTSSLLKLINHAMHGAETWYACVVERFHGNH